MQKDRNGRWQRGEVEQEELEGRCLGAKPYWSTTLNESWACRKHLHPQCMKEVMHKLESCVCCSSKHVPQRYPPKKKEKGELSAALYDVQKSSPESPRNECCAVPGRALWQEEHGLYFLIILWP